MTTSEAQNLIELHNKAGRILSLIRGNKIMIKLKHYNLPLCAILIHQCERLEYMYDDLICKIADVTLTKRSSSKY